MKCSESVFNYLFLLLRIPSCSDGLIKAVGPSEIIRAQFSEASCDKVIDATGMCVLPGEYQLRAALGHNSSRSHEMSD